MDMSLVTVRQFRAVMVTPIGCHGYRHGRHSSHELIVGMGGTLHMDSLSKLEHGWRQSFSAGRLSVDTWKLDR